MKTPPPGLADEAVLEAVRAGWSVPAVSVAYEPVGFGSHHWRIVGADGRRWFSSVDEILDAAVLDRLDGALRLAQSAHKHGVTCVVAPLPATDGAVVRRLGGGYALALYPWLDGRSSGFGDALDDASGRELADMLADLHAVPVEVTDARVDTLEPPGRVAIAAALAELDDAGEWSGPYAEALRRLLAGGAAVIEAALAMHERLVVAAGPQSKRTVLTHGEPHPGNLLATSSGLRLIDWDTALLAPPERDLWLADARSAGRVGIRYAGLTGCALLPELLRAYEIAWALADLEAFITSLRGTLICTEDTAWSWNALEDTVRELPGLLSRAETHA